jgi:hypothetical protein
MFSDFEAFFSTAGTNYDFFLIFFLFSRYFFFKCRSNPRLFSQPQPCIPKPQVFFLSFFVILPASAMYPKTTGLFSLFFCYSPSLSHVSQNHRSFFSLFYCSPSLSHVSQNHRSFFPLFILSFLLFSQPQPYLPPLRTTPPHHHHP